MHTIEVTKSITFNHEVHDLVMFDNPEIGNLQYGVIGDAYHSNYQPCYRVATTNRPCGISICYHLKESSITSHNLDDLAMSRVYKAIIFEENLFEPGQFNVDRIKKPGIGDQVVYRMTKHPGIYYGAVVGYTSEYSEDFNTKNAIIVQTRKLSEYNLHIHPFGLLYTDLNEDGTLKYGDWIIVDAGHKNSGLDENIWECLE